MSLRIEIETNVAGAERTSRIRLEGRLDTATSPQLEKELVPLVDGRFDTLIFDLAGLEFISSAGIRVLVHARKTMRAQLGGVLMVNAQPQIVKVFEIIKALPGLAIFSSQAELDQYLAEMQRRVRGD
ncbi:MAG TPA: STAS domain-containing protein [Methylomirabilota bacterium]|jgi:anti-anti-sigma factor|nr:STAS domain-containing protein [Methylomirabilota bacterium]